MPKLALPATSGSPSVSGIGRSHGFFGSGQFSRAVSICVSMYALGALAVESSTPSMYSMSLDNCSYRVSALIIVAPRGAFGTCSPARHR